MLPLSKRMEMLVTTDMLKKDEEHRNDMTNFGILMEIPGY